MPLFNIYCRIQSVLMNPPLIEYSDTRVGRTEVIYIFTALLQTHGMFQAVSISSIRNNIYDLSVRDCLEQGLTGLSLTAPIILAP